MKTPREIFDTALVGCLLVIGVLAITPAAPRTYAQGVTAASPPDAPPPAEEVTPDPWPKVFQRGGATYTVFQPQLDSWDGYRYAARAAVSVLPAGAKDPVFGVIEIAATTQVSRASRTVYFQEITIQKATFPSVPQKAAQYQQALQAIVAKGPSTMSLDRLQAALAIQGAEQKARAVPVKNALPQFVFAQRAAILVLIDGEPVWRAVPGTTLERVLTTRALVLRDASGNVYIHVFDGFVQAPALSGPWTVARNVPAAATIAQSLAAQGVVDLMEGPPDPKDPKKKPSLANGAPQVVVATALTELIVTEGPSDWVPLEGTNLLYVQNTTGNLFMNLNDQKTYVLVTGRWFRGPDFLGPWEYVPGTNLPPDFAQIPDASPKENMKASVPGTPEAQEAVIANSIPQTATIPRANGPTFAPTFDGAPQFRPIDGTPLQHVVNSPAPIIGVDARTYYALQAGVWFSATSLNGPWYVAPSVPAVIYTIPATSPLHYVTYVHVYGSTAQVVYTGYTPGYLGTVVAPDGVVVYGTGYAYQPWVGTAWYPPPVTYGVMAQPVYNPMVGMTYGFAMGVATASAAYAWGATPYYHPAYYGGYPCCGSASANVYGQYGSTAYSGTRTYSGSPGGAVGTTASGTYKNYATGTSGSYAAGRSYNPYTGQAQAGYERTYTTPQGVSGSVERGAAYNPQTGTLATGSAATATGPGGRTTSVEGGTASNVYGQQAAGAERTTTNPNTGISKTTETAGAAGPGGTAAGRQTTVTDTKTGQSATYGAGHVGNTAYADVNGNVYKNSGSGWEQHTSSGWQGASGDTSWADREQQARSQGESRYNSYQQGGYASRSGGGESGASHPGGASGASWGGRSEGSGGFRGRR